MGRKLYQNKYYTGSLRLTDWDYTDEGNYFITIRTKDKGNILGKIIDGKMISNKIGMITGEYLIEIPKHFPHIVLHEFVIMPDHVHVLLEINKRKHSDQNSVKPHHGVALHCNSHSDASHHGVRRHIKDNYVEPRYSVALQIKCPRKGSISIVINQFKGSVKRYCNKHHIKFTWQSKFYDRIIRDELEFESTRVYIRNNPKNHTINKTPIN
jgi:REP element-mobilizing transposase RayT